MSNTLYDKARQAFLDGDISWKNNTIKVALVTSTYRPDFSSDEVLSKISSQHVISTSTPLTGKTSVAGIADADDVTFSVANNNAVTGSVAAVVIYQEGATRDTSRLIAYLDQINGLPILNATNNSLTIHWDNGLNKIFKL